MSTEMVGHPLARVIRWNLRARRVALARLALLQARFGREYADGPRPPVVPDARVFLDLRRVLACFSVRLGMHFGLVAIVAAVLLGDFDGSWSRQVALTPRVADRLALTRDTRGGEIVYEVGPIGIGPIALAARASPLAPALQRPRELAGSYQALHQLQAGETLGALAHRYGISLESLIWANGLQNGDALVVGQILRVPHISGLPHVVGAGETVKALAEQYAVPLEAIATFPGNSLDNELQVLPGVEIFIPGATRPLPPAWLQAMGGMEGLAARGAELAGVVRADETNLRTGPSTDHPRVAYLAAGRRLVLRARHADWVQVQLGALQGWVRSDLLILSEEHVAQLPETSDFPPAPPRWVWPARGTLTSGFGARWGGFHNGIDIANRAWSPIVAARSGIVREAGWCSGYGYCVKLAHGGGVETIYGHLIDRPTVSRGDEVAAGELIGYMGSTYDRAGGGYSTGVHLHFTVLVNGKAINPLRVLP